MLLVIDIGNTETVLGIYHHEQLKAIWRFSSRSPRTSDECWVLIQAWCKNSGIDFAAFSCIIISSVVPSLTAVFKQMVSEYLDLEPIIVTSEIDTGVKIQYDMPEHVGSDRICNAVAGSLLYGIPLIVVDLGTATTFDVVSAERVYLGGVIALGLMGASSELHRVAAKLPRVDLVFPKEVVGKTTEKSIQSGLLWGMVALIDGMVTKIKYEMNWKQAYVVGTGGLASLIAEHSKTIQHVNPVLTLEGMRLIYHRLNEQQ
ncbi:type III pantothenate kinase [bacterium]|nr:type III pantothenate kinase [bacterium]